jgi:hypothetical protein
MSSDYFDSSTHQVTAGTRVRASDFNSSIDAIDVGLQKLPSEVNIKRGLINYAVDSGIADAYVVTLTYVPTSYADGMEVIFKASAVNTGASTINVNALGVKSIKRQDGSELIAGDLPANKIISIRYNSTSGFFEIQGTLSIGGAGTMALQNATAVAISGGTIAGITAGAGVGAVATIDGAQTLTSKTLTSPVINTGVSGTAIVDEDNMASDSATKVPTQQSVKAYADSIGVAANSYTDLAKAALAFWEMKRAIFTYNGGAVAYTIKLGAGFYHVKDKVAKWVAELTTAAIGTPVAATPYYLYLDYSAITSWTNITNAALIWSATPPTYSHTLAGWYNGDDLCIFAVRTNAGPTNIVEFFHNEDLVMYADQITDANAVDQANDFSDIVTLTIPAFCRKALVTFQYAYSNATGTAYWRTYGQTGTVGHTIGTLIINIGGWVTSQCIVYTSSDLKINTKDSAVGGNNLTTFTDGWFFPEGM